MESRELNWWRIYRKGELVLSYPPDAEDKAREVLAFHSEEFPERGPWTLSRTVSHD